MIHTDLSHLGPEWMRTVCKPVSAVLVMTQGVGRLDVEKVVSEHKWTVGQRVFVLLLPLGHMIGDISKEKNCVWIELDPWNGMKSPSDQA